MQDILNNTAVLIIIVASAAIGMFALAFLSVLLISNKKIIQEQRLKIEDVQISEQHYKALFENSLVGMMKFNYISWVVLDANRTLIEMFNCTSKYELQQVFAEFPLEKYHDTESSLQRNGIVDSCEIEFTLKSGIKRRFLFSARRVGDSELAHAVFAFDNAFRNLG